MSPEEAKPYDPQAHEEAIYKQWLDSGVFEPKGKGQPFVIMMPPPNVTGNLHMGHALEHTLMDALTRYHRMLGEPALLVPGTDHAALPTNALIEKQLKKEGLTKYDIGREQFMERVAAWYQQYSGQIQNQMKRLGDSCDWSRFTFTMDAEYITAVQEAFIRHYKKGYVYRGTRLVNWCPDCASVISDLEIIHEDRDTQLVTLKYFLKDSESFIEVATTRPETMLGDTAVAVHPEDERYASMIGKTVVLPLTGREIPIIADDRIDKAFGTGAVKVTPAHDPLDNALGKTHNVPEISVIDEDGLMTAQAGDYAGMKVLAARQAVVEKLRELGVVTKEETFKHSVALCDRSKTVIEPLLSKQWFVKMGELKEKTRQAVDSGEVTFHAPRWKKNLLEWVDNEHDWTISRQIWLGQQIPVWWKKGTRGTENEEGNYIVSIEKPASATGFGEAEQDPDVVDTWFSSALWPLATLGWPNETEDLKKYYPTSFLTTARDILNLWEHRMIFSGMEFMGKAPFANVLIHPTVLNKKGQRMSKSLGTGIDPLDLINQYGADATRFALLFQMSYDQQAIKFDEDIVKTARNFANKLWNIARFIQQMETGSPTPLWAGVWINERAAAVTQEVTTLLNEFKLGEATRVLYDFVWNDFADWYVEILKLYGSKANTLNLFRTVLKLLHPFMPFVTEVLWKQVGGEGMLIVAPWPLSETENAAGDVMAEMQRFQEVVKAVRSVRALLALSPKEKITITAPAVVDTVALEALARCQITEEISGHVWRFPLPTGEGAIEVDASRISPELAAKAQQRLQKQITDTENMIAIGEKILRQMKDRATPEALQEKEQALATAHARLKELQQSLSALR